MMTTTGRMIGTCISMALMMASVAAQAGSVSVERPWARATPGQSANGAAYLTIRNSGEADRLISATSPASSVVELHTHLNDNGVLRMRAVESISIPQGARVAMEPGGDHIMLIGLKGPLKEGRRVTLTLTFEKAGRVEIDMPVLAVGARGPN